PRVLEQAVQRQRGGHHRALDRIHVSPPSGRATVRATVRAIAILLVSRGGVSASVLSGSVLSGSVLSASVLSASVPQCLIPAETSRADRSGNACRAAWHECASDRNRAGRVHWPARVRARSLRAAGPCARRTSRPAPRLSDAAH